jgi:phosphoglucosamine mutase
MHSFKNVKVGLDLANGAAFSIAKSVFDALGAQTFVINNNPNGNNINDNAGSTHIEVLQKFVKDNHLDIGFAFDGDADRCLAVDEFGNAVNGDQIMYICAKKMKEEGSLKDNTVVTTVMSNLGLFKAFEKIGIKTVITKVGDRYVYEKMQEGGYSLGGEQSGHIIFSKHATTGDGIVTSLKLMETVLAEKTTLSELTKEVPMFPQVLKNVKVEDKNKVMEDPDVLNSANEVEKALGSNGRILLRQSGTEPLVRIMVEASDIDTCNKYVDMVYKVIEKKGYIVK